MRLKSRYPFLCISSAALLFASSWQMKADTVAYWQFESANIAADSSGKGNDLAINGVIPNTDKDSRAPGNGSGAFGGSAFAQTIADLDLSGYPALTFEWFMKTDQDNLGVIFESSQNFNGIAGAVVVYINEGANNNIVWGNLTTRGYSNYSDNYPKDGQWHHYAVTIDTTRTDSLRQKVFIDGVDVGAVGGALGGTQAEPLGVLPFFIGARAGANFFLNGLIDEFRISDRVLDPDEFLAPISYPDATLTISREPEDVTALENQTANGGAAVVLEGGVQVNNAPGSAVRYQWQVLAPGTTTWVDIAGATSTKYTVQSLTRADQGMKYRLRARVVGSSATATSREAVLNITIDNTGPQLLSAGSVQGTVGVCFNEALNAVTAALPANYRIGASVATAAELQSNGRSVKLTFDNAPTGDFTVTVNGVSDLAGNTVAPNSQISGKVSNLIVQDIYPDLEPVFQPGWAFSCAEGEITAYAGGRDIWGPADSFQFLHETRNGDFDIRTQVKSIQANSFYARGGLMVRESLAADSRNIHVPIYPTRSVFGMTQRLTTGGGTDLVGQFIDFGPIGVAFPNVWVRLKREGNTFRSFWSKDGENWNLIGVTIPDPAYPAEVYVGLGTTAQQDDVGVVARAEFDNYSNVVLGEAVITITSQPTSLLLPEGASAIFSVGVDVSGVPASEGTYQWQRDGQDIPGAVSASYIVGPLTTADSGAKFRVIVKAGTKSITSSEATLGVRPNPSLVQRSINGVEVFTADGRVSNNRGDQAASIDGDINTFSYMTPSGTAAPQIIAFDLGETPMLVNRIRVAKISNTDGLGGVDNMDIEILFSSETGPLQNRTYNRVTGLVNGYYGAELILAKSVSEDGRVDNDSHGLTPNGWYALTFDAARATAIAIRVARDSTDPFPFVHYPMYEVQLYNDNDFSNATITVTQDPQSQTVAEFLSATFNVVASASGAPATALAYQWKKDGADIPGATGSSYTVPVVTRQDNGAAYSVTVSLGSSSKTSAAAILSVQLDQTPPQVVSANSLDGASIGVCFDEVLNPDSAALASNYTLSGGGQVTAATLMPDGKSVQLAVSGLTGATFTLTVQGVKDRAGNTVASAQVNGKVHGFTSTDIAPEGAPVLQPGSIFSCIEGEIEVWAGGLDVWGPSDSFHYLYEERTGDFDVRTKVEAVEVASFYARGGLMVRESLSSDSRNIHVPIYPTRSVFGMFQRSSTGGITEQVGSFINWNALGVQFPNVWVRLKREGNTFKSYWSQNGLDWTLIGSTTPSLPYPDTAYVGLGTTAQRDEAGFSAYARYVDYSNTPVVPVSIVTPPSGGTRYVGGTFKLEVRFRGTDPYQIQWLKDGVAINGANSSTLSLTGLTLADAGEYKVRISNAGATVTSDAAVLVVLEPNVVSHKLPISDIEVFISDTKVLDNRGDEDRAIDSDINTETYLTPGSSVVPHTVALDLGSTKSVNRIRVAKGANTDGTGALVDNMDLEILYSTDSGPLNVRNYQRVSGLTTGFLNEEVINAVAVNTDGSVDNDRHNFATEGYFSLRFNPVNATAIAIKVSRDPADERVFTHYLVWEIELYNDEGGDSGIKLQVAREGDQLVISWPSNATGFNLESSAQVGPGAAWTQVQGQVVEAGGTKSVRVNLTGAAQFYRLVR